MNTLSKVLGTTVIAGLIAVNLAFLSGVAVASTLQTQDIILSANGAAGAQDWEYNAAQGQGWVQHSVNWNPGNVSEVRWRCVDNCQDDYKFQYRIKFDNGRMALMMRATNGEQGLVRLQLTALVD